MNQSAGSSEHKPAELVPARKTDLLFPNGKKKQFPASPDGKQEQLPASADEKKAQLQVSADEKKAQLPVPLNRKKERLQIRRGKTLKKKIITGSAAAAAGLSLLTAGLFHSPSDLLQQQAVQQSDLRPVIEIISEEQEEISEEEERKKSPEDTDGSGFFGKIRAGLRRMILKLPTAVRLCIGIPLWAIGYGLIHVLSFLLKGILAPVLADVIGWALLALVLLGVFAAVVKCLFPDMPLRKILSPRNITFVLIGALVLKAADLILPLFWSGYESLRFPVMLTAGLTVLGILLFYICRRRRRRDKAGKIERDREREEEQIPELSMDAIEVQIQEQLDAKEQKDAVLPLKTQSGADANRSEDQDVGK